MKRSIVLLTIAAAALFLVFTAAAPAASAADGSRIVVPASSIEHPEDIGVRAHTNIILNIHPDGTTPPVNAETPGSLNCVYHLVKVTKGCPIPTSTILPTGGVGAIALVDAYDNPDATADIKTYAAQFKIPSYTFSQVYASGKQPSNDPGGWSLEEALDIEMAVATAPAAQIILVEAASNSFADLYTAEQVAANLVAAAGGGTVSNSWSGGEYSSELSDEKTYFTTPGVVYFASTGDSGLNNIGVPAVFASVVAAGGTSIIRSGGKFSSESWWTGGGGGSSRYEKRPSYQNVIKAIVGSARGIPDMSADANPNTGPAMYDADGGYGWFQVGGTSVSSPFLAGVVNAAGKLRKSSKSELKKLYADYANATDYKKWFRDITTPTGGSCKVGWDFCTGIGSPLTYKGK